MNGLDYSLNSLNIKNIYPRKKIYFQTIQEINSEDFKEFEFNYKSNKKLIFLSSLSFDLKIIGVVCHKYINSIKLPFFLILWTSNDFLSLKKINQISHYLLIKYYCLGVKLFTNKIQKDKIKIGKIKKSNFLIKSSTELDLDYIPPLGSELETILY
tara:strand:- start:284 stop:751 length:468 start_codon:yes stop_codon:yes gene_type:complete